MTSWYASAPGRMLNKEIDYDTDNIRATLHTATYAPNLDLHDYVNDLAGELAAGGGYTAGGVALASRTIVYTAANSWGTAWAASTAYTVDRVVRPTAGNGRVYRAVTAGTSGAAQPTWPTVVGQTVTDGGVTWECVGRGVVVLDAADVTWATASFTGVRYLVLSDRTPTTTATQPLIGLVDFVTDRAGGGGAFTMEWDAQGLLHVFVP